MLESIILPVTVLLALVFDFGNGFNDAANSISTIVATRVLSLKGAVVLAAVANFSAFFIFGLAVATTIGKGIITTSSATPLVILSGLLGAILWVYATTLTGLPISASHALIGGLIGAAVVNAGFQSLMLSGILVVVAFIFIAPVLGTIGAFLFSKVVMRIAGNSTPEKVNKRFRKLQLVSVTAFSMSHGTNDAQKTMGIIALALFSAGMLGKEFYIPLWVILASYAAIALGTLCGGWRVVKTMGFSLTRLKPIHGFCAETAGAATIMFSSMFGIPVSTTHVISGSIIGVGVARRVSAVRWQTARKIFYAWVLTIPVTAIIGAGAFLLLKPLIG